MGSETSETRTIDCSEPGCPWGGRSVRTDTGIATLAEALRAGGWIPGCVEIARLASDPKTRLVPIIARYHEGRFVAPAQDTALFVRGARLAGYTLRDLSVTAQAAREWGIVCERAGWPVYAAVGLPDEAPPRREGGS